tara:strand:- start:14840 stop:15067 length:228 start_codon:yes stop_codon:yes gene_type:complete
MKNKDELRKSQGKLTSMETENTKGIIAELEKFLENGDVNDTGLVILENIQDTLSVLRRNYTNRVISLLKQGHMLD